MTRAEQMAWRQRGFAWGRYGRGVRIERAREAGPEAVRWYVDGKRAGERQAVLSGREQKQEVSLPGPSRHGHSRPLSTEAQG